MPTTRKRHMVTETEPVQQALDTLRDRGCRVDMSELVVLGAQAKLAEHEQALRGDEERLRLRAEFLELTAETTTFDLNAALEVRERGWAHG